ncbi:MAG: hypothetical protein ACYTFA_17790 [Planctomycetota bacterium]|jgi:hypothetical protein
MHARLYVKCDALLVLLAACVVVRAQAPVGTAFTYQGQLKQAGVPVNGAADFVFRLWDAETGGAMVGSVDPDSVNVVDGLFTVQLDFGAGAFNGDARWLEIEVEFPSGAGNWTTLAPRQPLTPAPYAMYAADGGGGSLWQASGADIYYNDGDVGIGTPDPLALEHIRGSDLALGATALHGDDVIVEQGDAVVGLYSTGYGSWGSSVALGELDPAGDLVDKWTLTRLTSGSARGSALRFTFGPNADYANNTTVMHMAPSGHVGIGPLDPESKLHVAGGNVRVDGEVMVYQNDTLVAETSQGGQGASWVFRNAQTGGAAAWVGTSTSDGAGHVILRDREGTTTMVEIDGDGDDFQDDDTSGLIRIRSTGGGPGGELNIENDDGNTTIQAFGGSTSAGGTLRLFNEAGTDTIFLDSDDINDGGMRLSDANGNVGIRIRADHASDAGEISLYNDDGYETVELRAAEGTNDGGQIILRKASGATTVELDAQKGAGGAAYLSLVGGTADPTLRLTGGGARRDDATLHVTNTRADSGMAAFMSNNCDYATVHIENDGPGQTLWLENNGGGHLIVARTPERWQFWVDSDGITNTRVLQIHGGADLSEGFDVRGLPADSGNDTAPFSEEGQSQTPNPGAAGVTPVAGMVVSIDPEDPGMLVVSSQPYDRKVAGIISGAGGVNPGMLMGQDGSDADGAYPVALTGRVYCLCNASSGAIKPGDLLTTSGTPGHAMRVIDHTRAQGAMIGKAMSSLPEGAGLVLVLVSLQ